MRNGKHLSAAILIIGTFVSLHARATDIYRWVDDEGIVHFSDTRPGDDSGVRTLQVHSSNPPGYDPSEDPYSVANQAKRVNDKWSELADEREKREEKRREQAQQYVQNEPPRYDGLHRVYWPGYYAPMYPSRPSLRQLKTISRQVTAMDSLNLTGPRPHSINSGAHNSRVQSSNNFLSAVSKTAPRLMPRRN